MLEFVATSTTGLESVVLRELRNLGYSPRNSAEEVGRTYFSGEFEDLVKANIWLRCAGKVLIKLAEFEVRDDFDVIFDAVRAIEWENWARWDAKFVVDGRSVRSQITSVPALQRTVKKAIVERLCRVWSMGSLPETGAEYEVEISLLKNKATITLNTSGRGLHRRGYRLMNVAAPLRETIASALVQLSVWGPDRPLVDPFCASGTIPIEAAMLGRNIAPGLNRTFAAQEWFVIPAKLWEDARTEARDLIKPRLEEKIIGSDIDGEALKFARKHAELAGVGKDIEFVTRDFRDLSDSREYGCVISNPPYGDRIGEINELRSLYESIPAVLSKLPTWSHYIITSWSDFEKTIGQEATRRRKLFNSRIECVYYQFPGPIPPWRRSGKKDEENSENADKPQIDHSTELSATVSTVRAEAHEASESRIIRPVFAGLDELAERQATEFGRCLANRARHLRRYPSRGITCFRLYDRDLPEVPLAIDYFDEQWLHIAEYERPDDRTVGQHRLWLDKMAATAAQVVGVAPENVFLKRRTRQRGSSQYEKTSESGRIVRVHEGGLTFLCNMTDYLDVGLFLDHRNTRSMVRREAQGKRFLNLFCYSGAFTCYAADGGAESTVSVDLSPNYLSWCEANMEENDSERSRQGRHQYVRSDVLRFLRAIPPASARNKDVVKLIEETAGEVGDTKRRANYSKRNGAPHRAGGRVRGVLPEGAFNVLNSDFDLVVCDPPTFSNSKSTEEDWDVQRRHVELLRILATRMSPGGVLYFSNNFRKFRLDEEALQDLYDFREITNRTIPDDFRNKRIHRCWRMIAK